MKNSSQYNTKEGKDRMGGDLNLYAMSKDSLVKRVQILMHELAINQRYEQSKEHLQRKDSEVIRKELVQRDIIIEQMKKNEALLQNALKAKTKNIESLAQEVNEKETLSANLKKENESLKKKIALIEKSKVKESNEKIEAITKEFKNKQEFLDEQNKKFKRMVQELSNKVKILNQLNEETEQKLANAMISKKIGKETVRQEPEIKEKENIDTNKPQSNLKLENLSLKDQIRKLKQELFSSQEAKQVLKSKFHQRQLFYSRMISLKQ